MTRFRVTVKYRHRKWGPQSAHFDVNATNIRVATNAGLQQFFRAYEEVGGDRAAYNWLACEAVRLSGTNAAKEAPASD